MCQEIVISSNSNEVKQIDNGNHEEDEEEVEIEERELRNSIFSVIY